MYTIIMETDCENCGGSAYLQQVSGKSEVFIDFLEHTPFECKCGATTYLEINKMVEVDEDM